MLSVSCPFTFYCRPELCYKALVFFLKLSNLLVGFQDLRASFLASELSDICSFRIGLLVATAIKFMLRL